MSQHPTEQEEAQWAMDDLRTLMQKRIDSAETRFKLVLQEREFFAKQLRDIRQAVVELDDSHDIVYRIERILDRPNPLA